MHPEYRGSAHSVHRCLHPVANGARTVSALLMMKPWEYSFRLFDRFQESDMSEASSKTAGKTSTLRLLLSHATLAMAGLVMVLPASQALAGPLSWLTGEKVQGSGTIKKQNRELAHFTGVSMSLAGSLELRMGNTESVSVETDDNLLPLVETVVEDGTLRVRTAKKHMSLEAHTLKIVVTARTIDHLSLGGSGTIDADTLRSPKLQLDLGGSGTITIKNVESDTLAVALGGSGAVKAGGSARKLSVSIGGSGDVQAESLKADDVSVNIGGSGQATVAPKQALSVSIAGSGDVNYYGDPAVNKSIVGSGGVKRLGGAR
jgi:hypothetical protein